MPTRVFSSCPQAGYTLKNLETYLSQPTVMMVGGTWIAKKETIAGGNGMKFGKIVGRSVTLLLKSEKVAAEKFTHQPPFIRNCCSVKHRLVMLGA
ncbi:hypothetical protein LCGC14_1909240 [marine sediment metagenome]|uniref:Uncharacterized protein n=1 Tax=marine sediment metagenome TaxID=412755 RepID=A0A0F9IS66_9ZZZZ